MSVFPPCAQRRPVFVTLNAFATGSKECGAGASKFLLLEPDLVDWLIYQPEYCMHEHERDERGQREPERGVSERGDDQQPTCRQNRAELPERSTNGEPRVVDRLNGKIRLPGQLELAGKFERVGKAKTHAHRDQDETKHLQELEHGGLCPIPRSLSQVSPAPQMARWAGGDRR